MSSFSRKTVKDVKTYVWLDGETIDTTFNGAEINVQNFRTMISRMKTENAAGTNPTLDIKWQAKMPNGDWVDLGIVFTQEDTNDEEVITNVDATLGTFIELGQVVRPVFTLGGTGPEFDITFDAIFKS